MITSIEPENWRELQNEVGKILNQCGFSVEIEKKIQTVRSKVEIDVYAEEYIKGRTNIILCECKYWNTRVPQSIILSFRTIMSDFGANIGYIISKSGFQSGAFKASENTNINLVTWYQFQDAFEEIWFNEYLTHQMVERLDPLISYTEPIFPSWFDKLTNADQDHYIALKKKYEHFGWLIIQFTPYVKIERKRRPQLPIMKFLPEFKNKIPENIASVSGYREFLELVCNYGEHAIAQFRAHKDKVKNH